MSLVTDIYLAKSLTGTHAKALVVQLSARLLLGSASSLENVSGRSFCSSTSALVQVEIDVEAKGATCKRERGGGEAGGRSARDWQPATPSILEHKVG